MRKKAVLKPLYSMKFLETSGPNLGIFPWLFQWVFPWFDGLRDVFQSIKKGTDFGRTMAFRLIQVEMYHFFNEKNVMGQDGPVKGLP
jgi:hypothetical protein